MASFLANGHRVELHAYSSIEGVPDGVDIKDANEVLGERAVFVNSGEGIGRGGFAGFSDWFRYELLCRHGGFWCDADMVCLQPFVFDSYGVVATSREGEWGTPALGCVLRIGAEDPLLRFCVEFCRQNNVAELVRESFIAVGPALLQRGIRELALDHYMTGPDVFCPVSWRHTRFLVSPDWVRQIYNIKRRIRGGELVERIKPASKGLHLWHSTWRLANIDANARHHRSSVYERLRRRHLGAALGASE